jgi:ABC-2 type transport system permease protein
LGKFFAAFALVVVALLPTLIYYFSIVELGNPVGNIDTAAVVGSYVGLLFLAAIFCAIGIFTSTLSNNQIVAFLLAAFFCFLLYTGFDSLSSFAGSQALLVKQFGILYHYESLGKGLIDTRDIIYSLSTAGLLLLFTKVVLGSRLW